MTTQETTRFLSAREIAKALTHQRLLRILEVMVLARVSDAKMGKLVRQNKGGTFHLGASGHELVGAVCASFLRPGIDWTCPYYRDQPLALGMGCDLTELFGVFLGRETERQGRGRMMPYHFSDQSRRVVTQSSVVGAQFLPAVGIAQGIQLRKADEVVYVSGGDGATSQGDFHEALNYAGLHKLPVIFVIHDNELAISVTAKEQVAGGSVAQAFSSRVGVQTHDVDGCECTELARAMLQSRERAHAGEGPSLIVARVPRMEPHSGSDDQRKYKDQAQLNSEIQRDPLPRFSQWLLNEQGITQEQIDTVYSRVHEAVETAASAALEIPFPTSGGAHVFCDWVPEPTASQAEGDSLVMVDAVNQTLSEEMERDPNLLVFGEDVARGKGGVFGATRGLTDRFGEARCFNTPLAEATVIGVALGLALDGTHRPVAEIQFADYLWPGFDLLVSEVASLHYRSGGEWQVPFVVRMPYGGYIQGGPYHSQSVEGILAHVPGLKVVIPSHAADAKGLLRTAIRDPNPVVFLEHKALYRQAKFCARPDPGPDYMIPFGQAAVVREGRDITVVGWGMMVVMAAELSAKLAKEGLRIEVIDLRTIVPVDIDTVIASVKKTGKLLVAHEAPRNCGFGAEIAAQVAEAAYEYLDGPVARVCGLDAPVPYSKPLEDAVLPQSADLEAAVRDLLEY